MLNVGGIAAGVFSRYLFPALGKAVCMQVQDGRT